MHNFFPKTPLLLFFISKSQRRIGRILPIDIHPIFFVTVADAQKLSKVNHNQIIYVS